MVEHLARKFRIAAWLISAALIILSAACTSMTSTPRISVDAAEQWALLPIDNLSDTAEADAQAITIIETQLRAKGIVSVDAYAPVRQVSLRTAGDRR